MRDTHMHVCFQNSWPSRGKVVFVPLYQTPVMLKCQRQKFHLSGRNIQVYGTTENWELELPWALHNQVTCSQGEMQGGEWFPWLQSLKNPHQTTQNCIKFCLPLSQKFWLFPPLAEPGASKPVIKKTRVGRNNFTDSWIKTWWVFDTCSHSVATWTRTWITLLPNLPRGTIRLGTNMAFLVCRKTVHLHDNSWTQSLFLNPKKLSKKKHWTVTFPCKEGDTALTPVQPFCRNIQQSQRSGPKQKDCLGLKTSSYFFLKQNSSH